MKLLVFTDTHDEESRLSILKSQAEQADIAVCTGDVTFFGENTEKILLELNAFPIPVVFIHGNHENLGEVEKILEKCSNIHFAHDNLVTIRGLQFLGYGGNGFRKREQPIEELPRKFPDAFHSRLVLLCHAPPADTRLDAIHDDWHVGSESLRELVVQKRPMLLICGHIHECFGEREMLAGTLCINPGPKGEYIEVIE
jgi:Icc-related predicted phosphoesterase